MYLAGRGPPSSPPIFGCLRINRMIMAMHASEQNSVTENAKLNKKKIKFYYFMLIISLKIYANLLSSLNTENIAIHSMVDGSHCPCQTDTQKDVDSVTSRHITHTSIGVFILNCCHFTSKRI